MKRRNIASTGLRVAVAGFLLCASLAGADEPPAGLSREDWSRIRRAVDVSSYHASRVAHGEDPAVRAANRQQAYSITFRRDGIEMVPAAGAPWRLGLSVTGYGYEHELRPVESAEPQAREERIEFDRGSLTEWYVNRPGGLEQGFRLEKPEPRRDEPVVLTMAVRGDLDASADGASVSFCDASGARRIRYAGLQAWDADGRRLRSRMQVEGRELRVVVEAQDARYPVTVDPVFVHEAQLFGHGDPIGEANAQAGSSVAVSGDTVAVGTPGQNAVLVFVRSGATWTEQQKITASDVLPGDGFGWSVALSGDTLVVGGNDGVFGDGRGFAYVFVRSGTAWLEQQELLPPGGVYNDTFGFSVAVSGDTLVVGEPGDSDPPTGFDTGSAYVYVRSAGHWSKQQQLNALDAEMLADFGRSVGVDGDTLIVGAPWKGSPPGSAAGSAYVFVRSGTSWTQQQELTGSDTATGDIFGFSVSISADTVAVGAPWNDDGSDVAGSAYVFLRSGTTWSEQQKLTVPDALSGRLGYSVSLSGDSLLVGAPNDPSLGFDTGSAYVFLRSGTTWTEQQKLTAPDAGVGDQLGTSVGISGDTLLVGAPQHDAPGGADAGSAYVFVLSGAAWGLQQQLFTLDDPGSDLFSLSVSVAGDTAAVGAPQDTTALGAYAGSVYVFVRSGISWSEQQKLTAPDGSYGDSFGARVSVSGDTLVAAATNQATPAGIFAGSAYVFVRSGGTWSLQQKLTAPDAAPYDYLGSGVALSGDTVVLGAYLDDTTGGVNAAGSAYVFVRSGTAWTLQQKLLAPNPGPDDLLGSSVALSGDTAAVAAPLRDAPGGADAGSVLVFVRSGTTWSLQQEVYPADGTPYAQFGYDVSLSGDTLAVGAAYDDTGAGIDAGSAYVFVRSGGAWSQQAKLVASDGAAGDYFGWRVALSDDTLAVEASLDDTPPGVDQGSVYVFERAGTAWSEQQKLVPDPPVGGVFGSIALAGGTLLVGAPASAHVYRGLTATDVGVTKTDGQTSVVPGQPVSYSMTVTSAGPDPAIGTRVVDTPPAALTDVTWTCSPSAGSTCPAAGSGAIDHVANLPVGGTLTYSLTGTVAAGATGSLTNSISAAPPAGVADPNPANDTATDTDTLTPVADLGVTKTDGQNAAVPGQRLTYTIAVTNAGPSDASGATLADSVPASLLGAAWTCSATVGASCTPSGSGNINDTVNLPAGGVLTYRLSATVDPLATGTLTNTATIGPSAGASDPDLANNTASDGDLLLALGFLAEGELVNGYDRQHDLAALPGPVADQDFFRIYQNGHTSFEVLLDGASGDIGSGSGPLLDLLASDAVTVVQASSPAGVGGSRSLRWMNALDQPVADQFVRVKSAGCTTDCDAADVYRLRARETTGFIPRFNNSGTQITVLVLENAGDQALDMDLRFWSPTGGSLGGTFASLGPWQSYVLDTSTIAPAVGGSITVANTGRFGQLSGKAVALEPATGFTFDTGLERRAR